MISTRFSKRQRLLKADDFQAVFSDPQFRLSHKYLLVLAKPSDGKEEEIARLGLVIAKKHVQLAVARNRIKRLIRESFRLQQHHIRGIDAIVLARRGIDQQSNQIILNTINKQWLTMRKKIDQVGLT
jgi:ribonuclease P protein component